MDGISLFKAHFTLQSPANCDGLNRCSLFSKRTCREIDSTSQTRQPASRAQRREGGGAPHGERDFIRWEDLAGLTRLLDWITDIDMQSH